MQVARFKDLSSHFTGLNVPVENADSYKEGLIPADVRESDSQHLNHPVNHTSTEICLKFMVRQMIGFYLAVLLDFSQIGIYLASIVSDQVSNVMLPRTNGGFTCKSG